jgi:hypothetical protein
MRTTILFAVIIFLLAAGCHHPAPKLSTLADSTKTDSTAVYQKITKSFPDARMVGDTDKDDNINSDRPWMDSLLANYIKFSKKPEIVYARQHQLKEESQFDQTGKNGKAVVFSYEIGHTVTEKDGSEPRFTADSWVAIDTVTHTLLERDADGKLTEWKR